MLDEATYDADVKRLFKRLVQAADSADPDVLEADGTADMVTFSTAKGEKVIVNTQRAVKQIWVAGAGRGVHFSRADDGRWLDDKGEGLELLGWVGDCLEKATGERLGL